MRGRCPVNMHLTASVIVLYTGAVLWTALVAGAGWHAMRVLFDAIPGRRPKQPSSREALKRAGYDARPPAGYR